jgi:hypothetical protein
MNKIIILITLIPWVLYCIFLSKNNLIKLKENHFVLSNINIKELLPIKNIVLFIVFIIISIIYKDSNQIELVNSLLFSSINIFLFIYSYYENNEFELDINSKDILSIILMAKTILMIMIISLTLKDILTIYNILFACSILNIIILYISNKIISIVRRINNEIKQL